MRTAIRWNRIGVAWVRATLLGMTLIPFLTANAQPEPQLDDWTAGFIHLAPSVIQTTNGCSQFQVHVIASVTDAAVFSLKFFFDSANLELLNITPASDTALHLMPAAIVADSLWLDGFFEPNRTGPNVHIATITARAISPDDAVSRVGFLSGIGYSGSASDIDTILFSGDSTTVLVEGTPALSPERLIIQTLSPPYNADSVLLRWRPVTHDVDGAIVTNPLYQVYFRNILTDSVFHVGSTFDTFYYHDAIQTGIHVIRYDSLGVPIDTSNVGIYFLQSCKTQP